MRRNGWIVVVGTFMFLGLEFTAQAEPRKLRFFVVSSYHREYLYSQETNKGFCAAMLQFGYLDTPQQAERYTKNDYIESSKAIIQKAWMDTKRKNSKPEMEAAAMQITQAIKAFEPDLLFLGDDNAANYIGNQFLDTEIPIVFWGINNTPVKYGLVDRPEHPGHNVTGVVELGYYEETLQLLKTLVPHVKTFAILSDESETGRSHVKAIESLAREGKLPLEWVETVSTGQFSVWKQKALELQEKVDAFFVAQYTVLKDEQEQYISAEEVTKWYLTHIHIPEAARSGQFIKNGMLCTANDPSSNQGFNAVVIAHDLLTKGMNPATYPTVIRKGGTIAVNVQRAKALGITLTPQMGIQEYVRESVLSEEPIPVTQ